MATWFIPVLKAVLPHVGKIVSATAPAFTKKSAEDTFDQRQLLQRQISELQSAASQNATHVKELAGQLQHTIETLEQASALAKATQQRTLWLSVGAMAISAISLCIVIVQVFVL
jgi:hypothetical protein